MKKRFIWYEQIINKLNNIQSNERTLLNNKQCASLLHSFLWFTYIYKIGLQKTSYRYCRIPPIYQYEYCKNEYCIPVRGIVFTHQAKRYFSYGCKNYVLQLLRSERSGECSIYKRKSLGWRIFPAPPWRFSNVNISGTTGDKGPKIQPHIVPILICSLPMYLSIWLARLARISVLARYT